MVLYILSCVYRIHVGFFILIILLTEYGIAKQQRASIATQHVDVTISLKNINMLN